VKVAVVGPTYPYRGGIAHYTTLLVRHLREAGHLTRLYSFTRQYPRWLFPGKTDKDPSQVKLQVDCEYVLDPINPFTWWRLYRKIRADAPDLLVLQWWVPYWTPCLTMLSRWIKRQTKIPIVYICHNVVPHEGGGILDRRLAMTALRQGDAFVVHSEQDLHRLRAMLPRAVITRTQHPTYQELAAPTPEEQVNALARELGLDLTRPIVLFFGFVRPYKGLEYLIQALPLARREIDVQLLVVGEFWVGAQFYRRYAREYGVEEAVVFVDRYIPNEELGPFFSLADVVALPYISATQSGVVQLAYGFGKPVITTRVGGLLEVVQDGYNGLVVPPQDEEMLAAAIVRYFNEGLAQMMEQHIAAERGAGRFSWQAMVTILEQTARQIAARQ
jgi:glycosyltransferase involved in cell wall biosynthesis